MRAGSIIALIFVIDFRRGVQRLFQVVSTDQRGRPVNAIFFHNPFRNINPAGFAVHFLVGKLLAENGVQIFLGQRLHRAGVQQRVGLLRHIRAEVIPLCRHLVFG